MKSDLFLGELRSALASKSYHDEASFESSGQNKSSEVFSSQKSIYSQSDVNYETNLGSLRGSLMRTPFYQNQRRNSPIKKSNNSDVIMEHAQILRPSPVTKRQKHSKKSKNRQIPSSLFNEPELQNNIHSEVPGKNIIDMINSIPSVMVEGYEFPIPKILIEMETTLKEFDGIDAIGIFHVDSAESLIRSAEKIFSTNKSKNSLPRNPYVISNCIKRWFASLEFRILDNVRLSDLELSESPSKSANLIDSLEEPIRTIIR